MFYLINAYYCYDQNSVSWIILIHHDFIKIVQDLRSTGVETRVVWREDEILMPAITCQSQPHMLEANRGRHSMYLCNILTCDSGPLLKVYLKQTCYSLNWLCLFTNGSCNGIPYILCSHSIQLIVTRQPEDRISSWILNISGWRLWLIMYKYWETSWAKGWLILDILCKLWTKNCTFILSL